MISRASNNTPASLRKLWQHQEQFGRAATNTMSVPASSRAIVSHDTFENGGWKMEEVGMRQPGEGELLVEMVATGVCHTDALIGGIPGGAAPVAFYPRVLGHEGIYLENVTLEDLQTDLTLRLRICTSCWARSHSRQIWRPSPLLIRFLRDLRNLQSRPLLQLQLFQRPELWTWKGLPASFQERRTRNRRHLLRSIFLCQLQHRKTMLRRERHRPRK